LYYLLFFEFLVPQPKFNDLIAINDEAAYGIAICFCAFGAMAAGRHIFARRFSDAWRVVQRPLAPSRIVSLYLLAFVVAYLPMLASVNFNRFTMFRYFFEPRFEVPWVRPQYGDWHALFFEIGAMIYTIPPLAGIILARRELYPRYQVVLVSMTLLVT